MNKERKYVQYYRDWWEALKMINDPSTRLLVGDMLLEYAFDGIIPSDNDISELDAEGRIFWRAVFSQLKSSRTHFECGCKSKGAPKGNTNAKKFAVPTLDEVRRYFDTHHYECDPEDFFDYNEASGWETAKKHFKNWETAADRWEVRGEEYGDYFATN